MVAREAEINAAVEVPLAVGVSPQSASGVEGQSKSAKRRAAKARAAAQAATRAAVPAGVMTAPTWPVSLCFRMSQGSENLKLIAELQAKADALAARKAELRERRTRARREQKERERARAREVAGSGVPAGGGAPERGVFVVMRELTPPHKIFELPPGEAL